MLVRELVSPSRKNIRKHRMTDERRSDGMLPSSDVLIAATYRQNRFIVASTYYVADVTRVHMKKPQREYMPNQI